MNDFEEYIRQSEPHKREKGYAWQTAIGLQAVDGLKTSDYLIQTYTIQSAKNMEDEVSKCNICTLNCTLEELAVWKYLKDNPRATQKEVAASIGKSERTIKTITVNLTNKGLLVRKNGRRNGYWDVNENK